VLAGLLAIPLAEACRRTGAPARARDVLAEGLDQVGDTSLHLGFAPAALVAAALAVDLGDADAAERLRCRWRDLSSTARLPPPLGYEGAAERVGLGLDVPADPRPWAVAPFRAALADARAWAHGRPWQAGVVTGRDAPVVTGE
jgi:hypothetical protein